MRWRRSIPLTFLALAVGSPSATLSAPAQPAPQADTLAQARSLQSAHHIEAATALLRPWVAAHPQDAAALTLLAQLRLQAAADSPSDTAAAKDEATRFLSAALAANPNSLEANLAAGQLLLGDHHDPEAMDRFETVLTLDPHNLQARAGESAAASELAVTARAASHADVALKVLEHAASRLPDDPQLLLTLGLQATELQQYPEAETALRTASQLKPNSPEILYAQARLDTERQHMQSAEEEFRRYLTLQPNDASAHFGLGRVLAVTQRADEARQEFERSIQLQPVQTESYYQIGQLELDAQHDDAASPLFAKVLARDPRHAGALTGMGILAYRAKNYTQAEALLASAEKSAPSYRPAHYYRALALTHLNRKPEAEEELKTAAALSRPTDPQPQR
jgi:tetratricopeptide (TPR) repeat protein